MSIDAEPDPAIVGCEAVDVSVATSATADVIDLGLVALAAAGKTKATPEAAEISVTAIAATPTLVVNVVPAPAVMTAVGVVQAAMGPGLTLFGDVNFTAESPDVKTTVAPSAAVVNVTATPAYPYLIVLPIPDAAELSFTGFRPHATGIVLARRGVAVDQAPGGFNYPFVGPTGQGTHDLGFLVADFYLSYEDSACSYTIPFKIKWLYGFGENPVDPLPGYPTPTHAFDILVVDADDQVVFDSTLAGVTVYTRSWSAALGIVEWQSSTQVCRIVYRVGRDPDDDPRIYDLHLAPTYAVLDSRTCEQLSRRVLSLQHGANVMQQDVVFVNGYNTVLTPTSRLNTDGGASGITLQISAEPGSGAGRYDGCIDQATSILKIDGQGPDAARNFLLDASECYRVERPSVLTGGHAVFTPATLQLFGECGPCCECDDFINVYEAIRKVWLEYYNLYLAATITRNGLLNVIGQYAQNRPDCPAPLRIGLASGGGGIVSVQIQYCNLSPVKDNGGTMKIEIKDSLSTHEEIGLICGHTFISGDGHDHGGGFGNATLTGTYPNYSHEIAQVRSRGQVIISFQLLYPKTKYDTPIPIRVKARYKGLVAEASITTQPDVQVC